MVPWVKKRNKQYNTGCPQVNHDMANARWGRSGYCFTAHKIISTTTPTNKKRKKKKLGAAFEFMAHWRSGQAFD